MSEPVKVEGKKAKPLPLVRWSVSDAGKNPVVIAETTAENAKKWYADQFGADIDKIKCERF